MIDLDTLLADPARRPPEGWSVRARYALWLEHHARTAQSPQRAAEEAAATCRGLYPHQARQTGKETNR